VSTPGTPSDPAPLQPTPALARTTCACRRCSICCEHIPGTLAPRDLPTIAAHKGHADPGAFAREFLSAGVGATIKLHDGRVISLPKLVPRSRPSGACVFYEHGRCTIHAVAPFGCSHFDAHMTDAEFTRRSDALNGALLADLQRSGPYSRTVAELHTLGKIAPPAAECKAALIAAMRRESLL
jgi:Fe-S-cluster containining protein